MSPPWVLVFSWPNGAAARRVGGLSLALRSALDAQRAGAAAVVCPPSVNVPKVLLADPRLRIPVVDAVPAGARPVAASPSVLFHRDVFSRTATEPSIASLDPSTPRPSGAYAFDPIDVVDRATAARAESALFRSLRKPQDGWTSRFLNRHVSLAISRWLVRTPLRPNQVSVAILAVGLAGAWLASRGSYGEVLVGAFLFQLQSILDGCDGEMSRVTYRGSLLGEWLDTIGDDVTNYGFFAGASLGLHAQTGSSLYLGAGAVVVGAGVTASLIEYRYLLKIGSGDLLKYPASQATTDGTGPLATIGPLFKRDTFVFLTLIAAALDLTGPMLLVFAAAAVGVLVNVLVTEAKMASKPARPRAPPGPPGPG